MTHIYHVECNTTHKHPFVVDVPIGFHWLLVVTKTPFEVWVDGEIKTYPAHHAVLFRPPQKVYYRACTDYYINNWIRFETSEPYLTESLFPYGVPFALEDPEYCHKLFELLVFEHHFNRIYKESSIDYLFRTLFNKLMESCRLDNINPHHYDLLRLRTAIQSTPNENWTVTKMADFIRISPGYLQTIYKKTFGISCMDDVIHSRIRLAKELLVYSTLSIAEIASHCGYQHVEHFCRQFKQLTGHTPKKFAKASRMNG